VVKAEILTWGPNRFVMCWAKRAGAVDGPWHPSERSTARAEHSARKTHEVESMCTYVTRAPAAPLPPTAWVLCTLIAVCGVRPASAAERTVLCEEFTNKW